MAWQLAKKRPQNFPLASVLYTNDSSDDHKSTTCRAILSSMDTSSRENGQELSTSEFWNDRYTQSNGTIPTHEWFKSFESLKPFFQSHLFSRAKGSRILHLGSGDSTIPQDLASLGFHNQIAVDFSAVVVDLMASRAKGSVEWKQADVRDLVEIPDQSVDVAFDKGCLDAMIYGSPWSPPDEVKENTSKYVREVFRVLKDTGGVFLYVTFRQPHFVKPLLNWNGMWDLQMEVLQEGESSFDYYAFTLSKGRG